MIYRWLVRPALMTLEPERAHQVAVSSMTHSAMRPFFSLNQKLFRQSSPRLHTSLCGIPLENPVGLAAGFDKNAELFNHVHRFGFGFVEIGTVTAHAQSGNPKPRLFRLVDDQALINRMGFNNEGAQTAAERLARHQAPIPVGGNIGKSKVTPLEDAVDDYATSFQLLKPHVQYFVVNVSSPNTPNLRKLQAKEPLTQLLAHLMTLNREPRLPLLLKIAPDLHDDQLTEIVDVVTHCGIDGVIATNTTIERKGLECPSARLDEIGAGGLSGVPLRRRSTEVLRFLRSTLPPEVALVGVGGIASGADAYEKIRAGASCVQIYTSWIYRGPNAVFHILRELDELLIKDGFTSVADAIGADVPTRA